MKETRNERHVTQENSKKNKTKRHKKVTRTVN
jgi:hypothetical protein